MAVRASLIVLVSFLLVLASCAKVPAPEEANAAVLTLREYESWAWAMGIALIWADVVLPVPQTEVIAALGIVYGTALGGLLGSVGLITGGLLGYALMRTSARSVVQRLVRTRSLQKMERLFEQRGAWAIVLTRSFPYSVPEIIVFLAGLAGMPFRRFSAALILGSVPIGFAFAALGAGWADQPILALVVSYVLPVLLLPVVLHLLRPRGPRTGAPPSGRERAPLVANLVAFGLYLPSLFMFSGRPAGAPAWWLLSAGILLAAAGAAVVVRSRAALGPAWSFVPRADQGTGLVTTGPYRLVRHPIYLGFTLLALGGAVALGSGPAVLMVLCGIIPTLAWRAHVEERVLGRTFGEQYGTYQKRTKMIVPYLL